MISNSDGAVEDHFKTMQAIENKRISNDPHGF